MKQLKDIGELELVSFITKKINKANNLSGNYDISSDKDKPSLMKGIWDDAAILKMDENNSLLISKDILVEDIHFRLSYTTPDCLAKKAIAVNLSDIAAMGGYPKWVLIGLSVPATTSFSFIDTMYEAFLNISKEHNIKIIGGDTCSSSGPIMLSITVIGQINSDKIIYRRGAKIGDSIMVCGTLGGSKAGFSLLELNKTREFKDKSNKEFNKVIDRLILKHLLPTPRLKVGALLAENELATSMIDISDGLIKDLGHICKQSSVGAEIEKFRLPIDPDIITIENLIAEDRYSCGLYGGEDYELLFTVPKDKTQKAKELVHKNTGVILSEIGSIVCSLKNEIVIIDEKGERKKAEKCGFEHFI